MTKIKVTCIVNLPVDANYKDTLAWVKFELGQVSNLNPSPISSFDLEATGVSVEDIS